MDWESISYRIKHKIDFKKGDFREWFNLNVRASIPSPILSLYCSVDREVISAISAVFVFILPTLLVRQGRIKFAILSGVFGLVVKLFLRVGAERRLKHEIVDTAVDESLDEMHRQWAR